MRGILVKYGTGLPAGVRAMSKQPPAVLEDAEKVVPPLTRRLLAKLKAGLDAASSGDKERLLGIGKRGDRYIAPC